jgi:hypothetical protein
MIDTKESMATKKVTFLNLTHLEPLLWNMRGILIGVLSSSLRGLTSKNTS